MKKLLTLLCALFALSIQTSKAVPILEIDFSQPHNHRWGVQLLITSTTPGSSLWIDDQLVYSGPVYFGFNGDAVRLLPVNYLSYFYMVPGTHEVEARVGSEVSSGFYTILAPRGPRPSVVPDGGSTLAMCAMAFGSLALLRRAKTAREA